jgi:hypothetical protein
VTHSFEEHRICLTLRARVTTALGPRDVTVQALSGHTAVLTSLAPLGLTGHTLDLHLPAANGGEVTVTAGIERVDDSGPGELTTVHFMLHEPAVRRALNELLVMLLGGDGGGTRRHPRVIYDTRVRFGDDGEFMGKLEELSLGGAGLRVGVALAEGLPFVLFVPSLMGAEELRLSARVINQRRAPDGGYRTGVAFDTLDEATAAQLRQLLADLMLR